MCVRGAWFKCSFDAPMSCKRRMWLLTRNTDATAIIGKQGIPWECKLRSGETSHKKQSPPLSFVPRQWGFAVFSGRPVFFLRGLVRFWVVLRGKAAQWQSCTGFLLTWCYEPWWRMSGFLWLPLFPSLWGDKTPRETGRSRFYGRVVLHHLV